MNATPALRGASVHLNNDILALSKHAQDKYIMEIITSFFLFNRYFPPS